VKVAEAAGDVASADLATQRIQIHEKAAWMLRATAS
jgi:starvation-inducible DNA-binding protein